MPKEADAKNAGQVAMSRMSGVEDYFKGLFYIPTQDSLPTAILGYLAPARGTKLLAMALAHVPTDTAKKPLLGKAVHPTLTKFVFTLGALATHIFTGKGPFTMGWLLGEVVDLANIGADWAGEKIGASLGSGRLAGVIGNRFGFEQGGIIGRQYGYEQGQISTQDVSELKKLQSQLRGTNGVSRGSERTRLVYRDAA